MMRAQRILFCGLIFLPVVGRAADWSQFRGSGGHGICDAKNIPSEWNADRNIKWKVDLPGRTNGSPVVADGHVYVTSADEDGRQRHLHCFDAATGSLKWTQTVEFSKKMPTHKTNLFGGTTPAANGQRVVVWHSSAGLHCYDVSGNKLWAKDLGEFRHMWGYGTSPIIHKGKVFLHTGPGKKVFVAAFDLESGDELWRTDEPVENNGERNLAGKYMGSWSTPVVVDVDGREILVCSLATRTNAYDLNDGSIKWSCSGLRGDRGDLAYTSPVIVGDLCVVMGGYKGPAVGFRMQGSGDITKDQQLWRNDQRTPQRIGSGVAVDGMIYMANAGPNTIECINPRTGESVWAERSAGAHWGSVVFVDGKLYSTDQNGTTVVFRPNPERFEQLAANRLEDPTNSTPAFADGVVYLRTFRHLYCIAEN